MIMTMIMTDYDVTFVTVAKSVESIEASLCSLLGAENKCTNKNPSLDGILTSDCVDTV